MAKLKEKAKAQVLKNQKKPAVQMEGYQENLDTPGMPYRFQRFDGQAVSERKEVGK